jgi:hypothetical protein
MERISYRIESKTKRADGTPDFVKFGTTANIDYTIKYHQFHLANRMHPDPAMMSYSDRHGWNCFEYIVDPEEVALIEYATIKPKKEVRKKKL